MDSSRNDGLLTEKEAKLRHLKAEVARLEAEFENNCLRTELESLRAVERLRVEHDSALQQEREITDMGRKLCQRAAGIQSINFFYFSDMHTHSCNVVRNAIAPHQGGRARGTVGCLCSSVTARSTRLDYAFCPESGPSPTAPSYHASMVLPPSVGVGISWLT